MIGRNKFMEILNRIAFAGCKIAIENKEKNYLSLHSLNPNPTIAKRERVELQRLNH
jgi:hypothetical protein